MSDEIVIGLFTLTGTIVGALLGGFFSVRSAKIGYKKERMEKDIKDLANQVKSYWFLEKEYLSQIKKYSNIPEATIMTNAREIVKNKGNEYPKMTANQADSILRKYE